MNAIKFQTNCPVSQHDPLPKIILAADAIVWVITAIKPLYWEDWLVENLLVFVVVPSLVWTYRRFRFSNISYWLIGIFMTMHSIGAHYTYSEVPLSDWLRNSGTSGPW